jgi:hypothetical protein
VVRFNNAYGFGGHRGGKVSDLFLINCGGQMEEWLETRALEGRSSFRLADRIVLPIPPASSSNKAPQEEASEKDAANHGRAAQRRFTELGKDVLFLPRHVEAECRTLTGGAPPSTGLIALHWLLGAGEGCPISCFGFGFAGWSGHDFSREEAYFRKAEAEGKLRLLHC